MPDIPSPVELLTDLDRALRARGVRWYVFGAQAVTVYGRPRLTADVDVTVEVAPGDLAKLVEELAGHGFLLQVSDPEDFVARTWVLPFLHEPSGMPLDLVLAGSGLEQRFLNRTRPADVGGVTVPLISCEDLVIAKVLAGRPKDLEDLKGVLQAQADGLDLAYVRATLTELERALDQANLNVTLDAITSGL